HWTALRATSRSPRAPTSTPATSTITRRSATIAKRTVPTDTVTRRPPPYEQQSHPALGRREAPRPQALLPPLPDASVRSERSPLSVAGGQRRRRMASLP